MRYIFKFPDIGEGLDEGTIAEWYVSKGQQVSSGDPLVKMETDKVVTDIPSPKTGIIAAVYGKVGETIKVGDPLVEIEIEGVDGKAAVEEANRELQTEAVEEEGAGVVGTLEVAGNSAYLPSSNEGAEISTESVPKNVRKALATPVARAMAKEMGVDINLVTGTGPGGRVMTEDIRKFVQSGKSLDVAKAVATKESGRVIYEPLTQLRKTIAKNMTASKHNAAHMTVHEEVDITRLKEIRDTLKKPFGEQGVKLSYLPFIIKAVTMGLRKHRDLNSQMDLDNNRMIYKMYYNIGIAVDTDDGLVVPVIRDVENLSIREIAMEINRISEKARDRKLGMDDMKDGTFTITNYGSIGGIFAVPVINYPQAGILGVGRMIEKPVFHGDTVVKAFILPLSLSVDHRIVDGGEVTRFIKTVMNYLENPLLLMAE